MNLQHLTLLLVLITLKCCYVICTKVERTQHPEFHDGRQITQYIGRDHSGSYGRVRKQWTAKHQRRWPRLAYQSGIEEGEVDIVPRPSINRPSKLLTPGDVPYEVSDDVGKHGLKTDDMDEIWNVGKVRQLLFGPIRSKHAKRAHDSVRLQKLLTPDHWNGQIRQYEEARKNILAVNKDRESYPSGKEEKADPLKCVGQRDGLYEAGPCERWYLSCRNGKPKKIFCANGLYWNGDKNRCEPKANIIYCRLRFDCSGMDDGIYVNGCSNIFWFCNSETASLSKCPKDLYFSINKLKCDLKETIPACSGIEQDVMKSISSRKISRKSEQKWREQVPYKMLKPHRKQGVCENREDGKYAIGKCYGKFLFCIDGKSLIVNCHNGQLYSPERQQCTDAGNLPSCRDSVDVETNTIAGHSVSCSSLPDGIYELGDCERNFTVCRNGMGSNASCGPGLVYNGQTGHCDYEFNVEKCSQLKKVEPEMHESDLADTGIAHKIMGLYRKQNICRRRENGIYAIAKCFGKYLFCIDGRGLVVVCSHGQLFSPEHQQCMDAGKLPSCANFINPETTTYAGYSAQCSSLSDGVYELGNCERNFLICFNGEGSIASCEPDFVYNEQTGRCDNKSKAEKCLKYRKSKRRRDKSALSPRNEDCRCKGQKDGLYAVGCTEKFYSCSNGISTGHECPSDLVFNVDSGFCDYPKNVVGCGGHQPMMNDEIDVDGEGTASNLVSGCAILEDGIYGLSPCGSGYYHCWRGATSFAKCAFDLVFNPSLNRCDFRENVPGCAQFNKASDKIKRPIHKFTIKPVEDGTSKCENLSDGFYVEGCSRTYYGCANGETFYMNCPWNLAFDYRSGTCDEPNNIEACRSTSSEEIHSSSFDGIAPLMPSCTTLPNGSYQLGLCLEDYILCRDGIVNLASCPDPLVFNPDNSQCDLRSDVVACGRVNQSTKNKLDVHCAVRPDGIFSYNCSKNFYICAKGKAYLFACPDGMVYDSKFTRCGNPAEVQTCVQTESSIAPQMPLHNSPVVIVKGDDKFCDGLPDGNYASGPCSRIFFSCVHMTKVLMSCPETLVFDPSTNRCEEPQNVAECRNSSTVTADVSSDSTTTPLCVGRKDSIYPLDPCSQSYLQCYNQRGIMKYCLDNMVFDGSISACIPKAACNQVMTSPYDATGSVGNNDIENTKLTENATKSLPRCYELADGDYSAGCVPDFITCIGGSEIRKRCPDSMVFSNVLRQCVSYDLCEFLMYRILASFHPSHIIYNHEEWMKEGNGMIAPSVSGPELSLPEASSSVAERCKYTQIQCFDKFDGNAINMPVSGKNANRCEYAIVQCANEASDDKNVNQIPPKEQPETSESYPEEENGNRFCMPEISESRIDSIRCDNMDDGLYALDCSNKVAVCSNGWKRIYGCPQGQLFIPSLIRCDESWKCTNTNPCGPGFVGVVYLGKFESITPSISSSLIGSFSCANKKDGNYGRQCSPIYVKCVQQIPILMRCQAGRLFDQRSSRCVSFDRCPMLSTTLDIGKIRCIENERFGIGNCIDYFYTCSNGKFVLYKCPPGHTFDSVHGVCGSKCDLCGGCQANDWTSTPACNPGEVVPLRPCGNTYLKCSAQRTFELRDCMKDKLFDSVLRTCRFRYEIAECFGVSMKEAGIISLPELYRVYDSFKHPLQLNPHLTRNVYDRNQNRLKLPYIQSAKTAPYQNPNMLFGTLRPPLHNIFIPQMTQGQHISRVFENLAGQLKGVKDIFRVNPSLLRSIPNMRTLGIIDQFHLPGHLPTYSFGASPPSPSLHDPTVASSSDPDGATNRNGAVDNLEGSGEGDNASAVTDGSRVKRDVSFETELSEMEMELGTGMTRKPEADLDTELEDGYFGSRPSLCPSKTRSANITLGVCRPNYIFCNVKENFAYLVDCNNGELFDGGLKECVSATDCILRTLYRQSNADEKTPCAFLSDGIYALPGCSRYFLSCISNKALLRSCANGLYYDESKQQCDYKEHVAICNSGSITSKQSLPSAKDHPNLENVKGEAKIMVTNADLEVPSALPNFTCSVNSTISLGCSPSFVICAGATAYVFNCDDDLVFDQTMSSCNRIEDTPECDEQDGKQKMLSVTNGFSYSSPLPGFDDLPHTFVNLTKVSYDVSSFDCINAPDGLYASQCSSLFFVCSTGHITGFLCQDSLVFNLETGFCDQKEYVASCEKFDLMKSPPTASSVAEKVSMKPSFINVQPSYHSAPLKRWKCEKGFNGIMSRGCSRKFVLCIHGEDHLFFCQQDLVYNINTNRCDHAQNVAACDDKNGIPFRKRAYETSHFEKDSIPSIRIVNMRAVSPSNRTIQARCHASQSHTAAYGHCRGDYISCLQAGTFRKSYCTNGYLFDEDVGRCVPAEVCGIVGDAVAESVSLEKEKCDGVDDGVSKAIGPCLSEYYVCKKGVPIRRRCFKHLETFSATSSSCVTRSYNPECPKRSIVLTDGIKKLNDTDDFCIHRPDGLYRHPADCARILQCFGEEMFEHLPCDDGLVFNEISGGCDYKSNVPECAATSEKSKEDNNSSLTDGSKCEGKSHGDHLPDEKDCSVFYRCIWGKLEKLFCPEHTVFNPALSVCDFPSAVPYCKVTM